MSTSQRWSPELGGREVANGRNTVFTTEEPRHLANRYFGRQGRACWRETGTDRTFPSVKVVTCLPVCVEVYGLASLRQVPTNRTSVRPRRARLPQGGDGVEPADGRGFRWVWLAAERLREKKCVATIVCVCVCACVCVCVCARALVSDCAYT